MAAFQAALLSQALSLSLWRIESSGSSFSLSLLICYARSAQTPLCKPGTGGYRVLHLCSLSSKITRWPHISAELAHTTNRRRAGASWLGSLRPHMYTYHCKLTLSQALTHAFRLCRGGMWINSSRHGSQCSTKHGSGRIKEANREYEISGLHGALAVI